VAGGGKSLSGDPTGTPLENQVRSFCQEWSLRVRYRQLDENPEFPWPEYRELGRRGWLAPRLSRGGPERVWSLREEAELIEGLARYGGSPFAKLVLQPEFCVLLQEATIPVREQWWRPLLRGEILVGNHVSEPEAGSDLGGMRMTAHREGTGADVTYVLDGIKSGVAFAADAQAAIVYARAPGTSGSRGISAFLVPQDLPGIRREVWQDHGERWMRRGEVRYEGVRIPEDHRIGPEGEALRLLRAELTHERLMLAFVYLGLARASWDETVEYVRHRRVFGRPLGSFEAVSFPLVEDRTRWEAAHLYAEAVRQRLDQGRPVEASAAMAKWLACETALTLLEHCLQAWGGRGYSHQELHELRFRDVRSGRIAHGSAEALRLVAVREILGREGLPYASSSKPPNSGGFPPVPP